MTNGRSGVHLFHHGSKWYAMLLDAVARVLTFYFETFSCQSAKSTVVVWPKISMFLAIVICTIVVFIFILFLAAENDDIRDV